MARKPIVNKRIVRCPEIECVVILANLAVEEQARFHSQIPAQCFVSGLRFVEGVRQNPSLKELRHQPVRFGIAQHATHLLFKHCRLAKPASLNRIQKDGTGTGVPNEFRHTNSKFGIAHTIGSVQ